jgi:biopolymer transport protein ExbD
MNLRSRNKVNATFSMSSMTDLVFLLLIFFIILSTMVTPYSLPVDLPVSKNRSESKQNVALRIDADLNYSVNNQIVNALDLEKEIAAKMGGVDKPSIVMHVDQRVPTGETVKILDMAKRNSWRIVLATKPK